MTEMKGKKGSAPGDNVCSNCLAPEGSESACKLMVCVRCGTVVYCSKDCQRAHWKVNHKHFCVAKADRVPLSQNSTSLRGGTISETISRGEECSVCLSSLKDTSVTTLQCAHVFHVACVAELRKFGVKQACPLCRTPLQPGLDRLNEDATRHYVVVARLVMRGEASWSALPPIAQRELKAAITGWRAAAEQGHAKAQYNLGLMSEDGYGVPQSNEDALQWHRRAANRGYAPAQYRMGLLLMEGRGVARGIVVGARWVRKAAEQGLIQAQCMLGSMLQEGHGVAQDFREALKWYSEAAEQGEVVAQFNLGSVYRFAACSIQSNLKAAFWWIRAANQGYAMAQLNLGLLFLEGCGVRQSDEEATRLWAMAAAQGEKEDAVTFGNHQLPGRRVTWSDADALRWYREGAAQGHPTAQVNLSGAVLKMASV